MNRPLIIAGVVYNFDTQFLFSCKTHDRHPVSRFNHQAQTSSAKPSLFFSILGRLPRHHGDWSVEGLAPKDPEVAVRATEYLDVQGRCLPVYIMTAHRSLPDGREELHHRLALGEREKGIGFLDVDGADVDVQDRE